MKELIFMRHLKTDQNIVDDSLGVKFIGRNTVGKIEIPSNDEIQKVKSLIGDVDYAISSPASRCVNSLRLVTDLNINCEGLLHEINYGKADGMYLKEIQREYGYLFDGWAKGEDPRFPEGENSADVLNRYKLFLGEMHKVPEGRYLVGTHNVFLRTVIGDVFGIPMKEHFKIKVPHFKPVKFSLEEGVLKLIDVKKEDFF